MSVFVGTLVFCAFTDTFRVEVLQLLDPCNTIEETILAQLVSFLQGEGSNKI